MKTFSKLALLALVCAFLLPAKGFSQERTNVIKANPLAMAFGNFNGTYEKVLNPKSSVLFSASYMFKLFDVDINAGGLGAGYRYYITHAKQEIPTGFWVMPEASFAFGSIKNSDVKGSFTTLSLGAQIGYQWAWDSGFTLDLGIGPHYSFVSGEAQDSFSSTSGILPAATLAVGFAF